MPQNVARHSLNVFQDYVAEYGFPDVMSTALVLVLLMERTVKERALRSVIVRRPVIQLLTAVGTVHQPGKDAASACTGLAMPLLAHLLYLLKHGFLDDGLMCIGEDGVKSHIVYRLCNHMVYTLSLIQPGVIVQEIALFECVNSLVQVDAADSELSEHQCDLPRERRLANGDAFPTKPFA